MLDLNNVKDVRKRLEKLDKVAIIDAFLYFLLDEPANKKMLAALEKTRDEAISFLDKNNLTEGIDDKDDKKFDRGVKWFKELPLLVKTINELKQTYLPDGVDKNTRSANANSIINFLEDK